MANDDAMGRPMDVQHFETGPPAPRKSSGWKTCLFICLGLLAVTVIGCLGGAWYLYNNGTALAANLGRQAVEQALQDVELPAEEKVAILAQVDRVVAAVREKRLDLARMGETLEKMQSSPLFAAWMMYAAEMKYLVPSGLSEEEKQAGVRVLQRVIRGLYEGTVSLDDLSSLESLVLDSAPQGPKKLKDKLTDDEVRSFLAACLEKVNAANVPDEPFQIRISEELKRVVDEALGEGPAMAEPTVELPTSGDEADAGVTSDEASVPESASESDTESADGEAP